MDPELRSCSAVRRISSWVSAAEPLPGKVDGAMRRRQLIRATARASLAACAARICAAYHAAREHDGGSDGRSGVCCPVVRHRPRNLASSVRPHRARRGSGPGQPRRRSRAGRSSRTGRGGNRSSIYIRLWAAFASSACGPPRIGRNLTGPTPSRRKVVELAGGRRPRPSGVVGVEREVIAAPQGPERAEMALIERK